MNTRLKTGQLEREILANEELIMRGFQELAALAIANHKLIAEHFSFRQSPGQQQLPTLPVQPLASGRKRLSD